MKTLREALQLIRSEADHAGVTVIQVAAFCTAALALAVAVIQGVQP